MQLLISVWLPLVGGVLSSFAIAWLLVHTRDLHLHLTGDHPAAGPQKQHEHPTPRVGGLAIFVGILVFVGILSASGGTLWQAFLGLSPAWLMFGLLPLYLLGLDEDIRKATSIRLRLIVSLIAGGVVWWFAGVRIQSAGFQWLDAWLVAWPWFSFCVTVLAVGGLVHAMNIVDGLNGLLAGITLVMLGVIAVVAHGVGDQAIVLTSAATAMGVAGFAFMNFPHGKIFCGDAGAYLIGFVVAVLVIALVQRNATVSPWFALAVVIHPVTETLYSAWRRIREGLRATHPDSRHMHSLWVERLRRQARASGHRPWPGASNPAAALRTMSVAAIPCVLAMLVPGKTAWLQIICAGYVTLFVFIVNRLEPPPEQSSFLDSSVMEEPPQ
jgi:UDP-GlcNAc:undecaprenyl-phosphate GlcNAc-1-phosphate transferase